MKTFSEQEILKLVTDELRATNQALKIGGQLALTETDFQFIGTLMLALKGREVVSEEKYNVDEMFIGSTHPVI